MPWQREYRHSYPLSPTSFGEGFRVGSVPVSALAEIDDIDEDDADAEQFLGAGPGELDLDQRLVNRGSPYFVRPAWARAD